MAHDDLCAALAGLNMYELMAWAGLRAAEGGGGGASTVAGGAEGGGWGQRGSDRSDRDQWRMQAVWSWILREDSEDSSNKNSEIIQ